MSDGRDPGDIWQTSIEEGERRLSRSPLGLGATGIVGGVDVMLGVMALAVVSGGVSLITHEHVGHLAGSLVFGIGFVLIVVGRSELFTENFMVPIGTLLARRGTMRQLGRLWSMTMLGNLVAIFVLAAMLTRAGLVPPEALKAAGTMADTFAERDFVAALLSAILAGTVMTLFTWLTHAVELDVSRILIALLIGFLLAAPSLNHAIVGVGEMALGLLAGTTHSATWTDLAQNFPVAVLGNVIGGVGFVTLARLFQVSGEPG